MSDPMIYAIALGIVVGLGVFFKMRSTSQQRKAAKKTATKHTPHRLRNPNIRRVK